jgi:D-inositol-3-phosphate glycosyltransferase
MAVDHRAESGIPMKIDIVSENAGPLLPAACRHPSAQSVHVRELALALARQNHDVTVWTRRVCADAPDTALLADAVRVRSLDAGPLRPASDREIVPHLPELAAQLRRAWSGDRPDVVHAHSWTSGMVALSAAREVDVPTVHTFHLLASVARRRQDQDRGGLTGRARAERSIAQAAGRLIATSTGQAEELTRLGATREVVRVIPHGIDVDEFNPEGPMLPRGKRPRVVHAGRLAPGRGADETVAAMAAVPGAELVLAGDFGPDDRDRIRIEQLAARYRVTDRLRLLEALPRARVPELLRSADVVVCVPWFGKFGVVALEAMACARPVVASEVGGLTDTVVNGVTGAHVPPRRLPELASTLRSVLGFPTMSTALGVAGRDRAEARYGWDRIADSTMDVYRQVISGG